MKRELLAHYVDTSMGESETYVLLGDVISSLEESMNPATESKQWINQSSGTNILKSYTPSIEVERDDCVDNDCRTWFKKMINELPTGEAAETYIVRVDLSSKPSTGSAYEAYRRKYVVQVGSTGGDAGGDVIDKITFGGCGGQIKGTFDTATNKFTPASA